VDILHRLLKHGPFMTLGHTKSQTVPPRISPRSKQIKGSNKVNSKVEHMIQPYI